MSKYDVLPFERGTTFGDGNTNVYGTGKNQKLLGKTYTVKDTQHDKGEDVVLRVVMWNHATGHTVSSDSGRGMSLVGAGTKGDAGAIVTSIVTATGEVAKPLDDAYTADLVIARYDLFYVVESGRCDINSGSTGALVAGTAVAYADDGTIGVAPATTEFVLGTLDETISVDAADDDVDFCVIVAAGITPGTA